ncbi:TniQ family protein [Nocardia sp. NPDC049737]|uniref:TniQ family protein n=1 Tax=Nocardia sp. NPDC049737 TaxID=3154358 RepID=UPI0034447700
MVSRLPIRIRPAADEIAVSYLNRLAALHEMPFTELWNQVSRPRNGTSTRRLDPDQFATVADQPRQRLARAIIELRDPEPDWLALRHEPQPGCWRCAAAHPGRPVLQLFGHHRYVCQRHRIWVGPPDLTGFPQPDLSGLPEIVAAQRAHLRLLQRLGPAACFDAVLTGFLICAHRWTDRREPAHGDARYRWARRADRLIPSGTELETFSCSRLFAATYPEAVDIAEVIGALHWRRMAAGNPDTQQRFAAEIGRRLGQPDYRPQVVRDPIAHWIDQDCWRPSSLPIHDYRSQRTYSGPSHRKPQQRNEEARFTSAAWFAQHRCGGDAMLHHRSLAPVILRDWSQPNVLFESALSASATITEARAERSTAASARVIGSLDFIRPGPVPTDYLDTAVEPASWPERTEPRQQSPPRPWSVSERPYFTPSPRQQRKFRLR